jgi:hypothetical protein
LPTIQPIVPTRTSGKRFLVFRVNDSDVVSPNVGMGKACGEQAERERLLVRRQSCSTN